MCTRDVVTASSYTVTCKVGQSMDRKCGGMGMGREVKDQGHKGQKSRERTEVEAVGVRGKERGQRSGPGFNFSPSWYPCYAHVALAT